MEKIRKNARTISIVLCANLMFSSCVNRSEEILNEKSDASVEKTLVNNLSARNAQEFTGEELFSAIFFAYGDFARKISLYDEVIANYDSGKMIDENLFISRYAQFVSDVKASNPNYFNDFKRDINTKDHFVIQNAIKNGSIEIYNHLDAIFPELNTVLSRLDEDPQVQAIYNKEGDITSEEKQLIASKTQEIMAELIPCGPTVCVAYFAFAVHNTAAITANLAAIAAAAIYLGVKLWGPKLESYKQGKVLSVSDSDYLKFEVLINEIATAN